MSQAYCVKCKAKRDFKHGQGKVVRTANNRHMLSGVCSQCGTRMNRFLSKGDMTDGNGLLSLLGLPIPDALKNIPVLGSLLF